MNQAVGFFDRSGDARRAGRHQLARLIDRGRGQANLIRAPMVDRQRQVAARAVQPVIAHLGDADDRGGLVEQLVNAIGVDHRAGVFAARIEREFTVQLDQAQAFGMQRLQTGFTVLH